MKHITTLLLLTTLFSIPVRAGEEIIDTTAQKDLNIVIYNNDRALVKDTRLVPLKQGTNDLAFSGISDQIIPESVVLNGNNITFLENNFNYDVLSYESLLEKSIGEAVTVSETNVKTGETMQYPAKLLALNNGQPTLLINGKIDSSNPGRILFNQIPNNLRAKPTLVMSVSSEQTNAQELTLGYLTRGLSWEANYVGQLDPVTQKLTLNGWVSLTNNSNTEYKNVLMQVVAGDVHLYEKYVARPLMMARKNVSFDLGAASVEMIQEDLADFHLYTLPRRTDILPRQQKQVSLLSASEIQAKKTYRFNNLKDFVGTDKTINPMVTVSFENTKENQLGIPLPKGVVRLYQQDNRGELVFIGEDGINHTGNLGTVRLNMGQAFDISATIKVTERKEHSSKDSDITEKTYTVTIKNGTKTAVTTEVNEHFTSKRWTIIKETAPSEKTTATTATWLITIPAGGETTLTYTVHEEWAK